MTLPITYCIDIDTAAADAWGRLSSCGCCRNFISLHFAVTRARATFGKQGCCNNTFLGLFLRNYLCRVDSDEPWNVTDMILDL